MLKKIRIDHFRGFKSFELDILHPLSVVMGPNSSGKTSILHAVRMTLEGLQIALEDGAPTIDAASKEVVVCRDLVVHDHTRLFPVESFEELFTDRQVDETTRLSIRLGFSAETAISDIELSLARARNALLKMTVKVKCDAAYDAVAALPKKSSVRPQKAREVLSRHAPSAILIPAFYGVTRHEEYRTFKLARRDLAGGDQSRVVRNLVARLTGDSYRRLGDFLQRSLGVILGKRSLSQDAEEAAHLFVQFRDTDGELELSSAGAGLVNLVALYSAMELFRGTKERPVLFLLDEPEAHLHPKLQGDVAESIAMIVEEFGSQALMATHSVEMINRLGQAGRASLIAVDKEASRAEVLAAEADVLNELSRWCDLSPFASMSFLKNRRILLHEGDADEAILNACADLYFGNNDQKLRVFRTWTFVPLSGAGNSAPAAKVLSGIFSPKVFFNIAAGKAVTAFVVLDRDYSRKPGYRTSNPAPHLRHTELVWPLHSIESLFLNTECLSAWLTLALVGFDSARLMRIVGDAVEDANRDFDLNVEASNQLVIEILHKGEEKLPNALKTAQRETKEHPEIWQRGKSRQAFVFEAIRERLPVPLRNKVRSSIEKLVVSTGSKGGSEISKLIPEEIRGLLDRMIAEAK